MMGAQSRPDLYPRPVSTRAGVVLSLGLVLHGVLQTGAPAQRRGSGGCGEVLVQRGEGNADQASDAEGAEVAALDQAVDEMGVAVEVLGNLCHAEHALRLGLSRGGGGGRERLSSHETHSVLLCLVRSGELSLKQN